MMRFALLLNSVLFLSFITQKKGGPDFSYKTYGNAANFFENEKDLLHFFEFKRGNTAAEVGAAEGENIGGFTLLTDSITYYVQDINPKALNEKNFNKVMKRCRKYKAFESNSFHIVLGNEKQTLLPENYFDKIILVCTFHELFYMEEMMADIWGKLKAGGKLYILEAKCLGKGHKNYTSDETISIVEKHNFKLERKDGKDLNGGSGVFRLVFLKH